MSSIESAGGIPIQQASLNTEIGIAVAAKRLDAQRQMGDAALKLLEAAAKLVNEAGKGGHIDSQA